MKKPDKFVSKEGVTPDRNAMHVVDPDVNALHHADGRKVAAEDRAAAVKRRAQARDVPRERGGRER